MVVFMPTTQSCPRLGLVVRSRVAAHSGVRGLCHLACPAVPKQQNGAIFVNIENSRKFVEGLRSCLSKPSYGASQWALMDRLMQKDRL